MSMFLDGHTPEDCLSCDKIDDCHYREVIPWVAEHRKEVADALEQEAGLLATILANGCHDNPLLLLCSDTLTSLAQACFVMGIYHTRSRTKVPQVFED